MRQDKDTVVASWEIAFPLVTNRFFLYDMVKAFAWTAVIMLILLAIAFTLAGNLGSLGGIFPVMGWVLAGLFGLMILISLIFFGNRYPTRFTLTERGVAWTGLSRTGRRASRLAVLLGALGGKPGVAGAGLLAASSNEGSLPWKSVRRVKISPSPRVITIMNSWRVVIRLYCTPENFEEVAGHVRRLADKASLKTQ